MQGGASAPTHGQGLARARAVISVVARYQRHQFLQFIGRCIVQHGPKRHALELIDAATQKLRHSVVGAQHLTVQIQHQSAQQVVCQHFPISGRIFHAQAGKHVAVTLEDRQEAGFIFFKQQTAGLANQQIAVKACQLEQGRVAILDSAGSVYHHQAAVHIAQNVIHIGHLLFQSDLAVLQLVVVLLKLTRQIIGAGQ